MSIAVFLTPQHPDGVEVDPTRPQLLVTDQAATRGDGVFETLLYRHGRIREEEAHLRRLAGSAAALDLSLPEAAHWRAAMALALGRFHEEAGEGAEASIRLTASRGVPGEGGTFWVLVSGVSRSAATAHGPADGLRVVLLDRGYDAAAADRAPWLLAGAKTLSYAINMAAQRWAQSHDADDAIFVTSDGRVLEGPTSSVLIARRTDAGVTLLTPELETGILAGTTQAAAFEVAREAGWSLGYGPLTPADLLEADGVWLVSSVRLAAAVTSIDGVSVPCDPELHRVLVEGLDAAL
ncbi:aminodeoxychorismate lyase [Galactobacter valiniphilus]|uniref:aminodeoxychorismate lyase n=1 Tax=Galactobacter valiniphilus TaxID=2676122 RepID=UPI0037365FFE